MKLIRPLSNYKVDSNKYLNEVLHDITENGFRITQYIGDKPKRSDAKGCKSNSSWFPCEYCFGKGEKVELMDNCRAAAKIKLQITEIETDISNYESGLFNEENALKLENLVKIKQELEKSLNALKRKSHIVWPFSTMNSENRTRQKILSILERIENNEQLSIDEAKGVISRSPLLDLPEFNFIYDAPAEYLHLTCLGIVKRMVELTFDVGLNRTRKTKRKLSSSAQFNKLKLKTKVVKECSRRARNLDFSVFKAQEFRNLCIFFSH